MTLVFLGTDFHDTPLVDLERFTVAAPTVLSALNPEQSPLDGVVVLSTCNRFEIYLETSTFHDAIHFVQRQLSQAFGIDIDELQRYFDVQCDDAVARHLFSVTSGLESMVIGEDEISGQVQRAATRSRELGYSSKSLHQLFRNAATVSKAVTTKTGLGASGRSVIHTALDIAREQIGSFTGKHVLLIGTGAYSRVVAAALHREGIANLYVYSRTGRAEHFATTHSGLPVAKNDLDTALASVDLVVSASGAKGYVVERTVVRQALAMRTSSTPLIAIDVSLSRDIDPDVAAEPGIVVIDLEQVRDRAPVEHVEAVLTAQDLVHNAVRDFEFDQARRSIDPVVSALRAEVARHVEYEIRAVERKKGSVVAEDVRRSLTRVTNALLHQPTIRAKELAESGGHDEYVRAIQLLFNVEVDQHV